MPQIPSPFLKQNQLRLCGCSILLEKTGPVSFPKADPMGQATRNLLRFPATISPDFPKASPAVLMCFKGRRARLDGKCGHL